MISRFISTVCLVKEDCVEKQATFVDKQSVAGTRAPITTITLLSSMGYERESRIESHALFHL